MAPLSKSTYQELEAMFETLKEVSQRPATIQDASEKAVAIRDQFRKMQTHLDQQLVTVSKEVDYEDWLKLSLMKSSLFYEEGKINMGVERYITARDDLKRSLEVIKGLEWDRRVCYLHLRVINHLAFILSKVDDLEGAKMALKNIVANTIPETAKTFNTEELFSVGRDDASDSQEKLHNICMNNLQMLSWIYSRLGQEAESAALQHTILEKEIEFGECDPVDWAMRCTRVASLYLVRKQFIAGRYYLSASTAAIERVENQILDHPELGRAQAELARGWIYYGLKLFDVSRTNEISHMSSKIFDDDPTGTEDYCPTPSEDLPQEEANEFHNSDVAIANVPVKPIQKYSEAKHLFHHTQTWLKRARVYYTLRDFPFIYVNCVLDLSELYRFFAFYEPELDAQYLLQKKRCGALETLSSVLKEVRPQCYLAVSVDLLRELAEVQLELLGINLKKIYKMQNQNPTCINNNLETVYEIHNKLEKVGAALTDGNLNVFQSTLNFETFAKELPPETSISRPESQKEPFLQDAQVN